MRRILVIEDESVLRTSTVRGLERLPAEVAGAATLGDALALVDRAPPDLIVSDIDLPDRSGIELIGELGLRKLSVPIIFVSAYLRAYRAQIPPHANVEILEKPVPLDDLRRVIRGRLGERAAAEDAPPPFAAADYVQLSCLGHHSVVIEVEPHAGGGGRIVVHLGEVWHAEDVHGRGVDAFGRLAFARDADVRCRTLASPPGPRSIEQRWEALLMDCARAHDEDTRDGPAVDADDDLDRAFAIDEVDPAELRLVEPVAPPEDPQARRFAELSERALEALLVRDYPRALVALIEARTIRPDDPIVATNLERLAVLGFTPPVESGPE